MKKRQILWAIAFGSMLAITGCGGDDGTGGTGGSGGSTAKDSCPVICDASCQMLELVDPASPTCLEDCAEVGFDSCYDETVALVACDEQARGGDCTINPNPPNGPCEAEGDAWAACP